MDTTPGCNADRYAVERPHRPDILSTSLRLSPARWGLFVRSCPDWDDLAVILVAVWSVQLCARNERPRRRTAQQCDEVAASHAVLPARLRRSTAPSARRRKVRKCLGPLLTRSESGRQPGCTAGFKAA